MFEGDACNSSGAKRAAGTQACTLGCLIFESEIARVVTVVETARWGVHDPRSMVPQT
jgi:hypothetical protein